MRGILCWRGKQHEKEGVTQTKHYEHTPTPVSHLPVKLVEERRWQKNQEQRGEFGKKGS